jgi:hypothetical protein
MSSLDLNLGITTGLEGNYSQFTLSENSDTKIDINDVFQGCIPFPDPVGTQCVNLITINPTSIDLMNVIAGFHYDQDQEGNVFSIPVLEFGLAHCGVNITANPSSAGDSSGPNIVLGPPPPGQDNLPAAWLITPNPNLMGFSLPDFALDTIAFFESPYGNHIGANFGCDWGP